MKRYSKIFIIFIIIINTICCHNDNEVEFLSGKIAIENVVEIDFPNGVFSEQQKVSVDISKDINTQDIFTEMAGLYRSTQNISYFIKITSEFMPNNDNIYAKINIPNDFLKSVPDGYGIELFAQIYQNGGEEIIDNFDILESTYDAESNVLNAFLPAYIFTNQRENNGLYEAILTISTTPGISNPETTRINDSDGECKASGIISPIDGDYKISSGYQLARTDPISQKESKSHLGVDFAVKVGTPVLAVADGIIERVTIQRDEETQAVKGYGLYIVIEHDDGSSTLYGHLSESNSKFKIGTWKQKEKNIRVKKGEEIGKSGGAIGHPYSGTSTGPHLHFDYIPNGEIVKSKNRIDPLPCILLDEAGYYDVYVTLTWNNNADLHLHITDPYGETISFENPRSFSGGFLDNNNTWGRGPENIIWWKGKAPCGNYDVYVHLYHSWEVPTYDVNGDGVINSDDDKARYSDYQVIVKAFGNNRSFSGSVGYFNQKIKITTFNENGIGN
ncbi:Murein DD-endopeptidase MepM [termite gut metagenome]|uniref:Murein DD-endopeptidase MepM n=1 Tax=termite gut metagenome TaxID=433724 RepID=A0A5J4QI92_9ZZZZ